MKTVKINGVVRSVISTAREGMVLVKMPHANVWYRLDRVEVVS